MSTEWITDRLPTKQDADEFGDVWVTLGNGFVCEWNWRSIKPQMPWQPTNKPAPYVKPKRWTVQWDGRTKHHYEIRLNHHYVCGLPELICDDIAQRIEDLFNEVMP